MSKTSGNTAVVTKDDSVVKLGISPDEVAEIKQSGDNLIVVLKNGEVITIDNFFDQACLDKKNDKNENNDVSYSEDGENSLVLEDSHHQLTWVRIDAAQDCLVFWELDNISSIDPLLYSHAPDAGALLVLAAGAAAVIGLVASDSDGGTTSTSENSGNQPKPPKPPEPPPPEPKPDTTAPNPPTVTITDSGNGDGGITVSGTGEPNSSITVTFPDGSSATTTTDGNGDYSIDSPPNQPSGTVSVTNTDPAGNTSNPT
ncbi:BapA/Bap/LapF family prefix-like domain-containing protein, partial [Stenoxybacter acetivorans]|uniref:BapA/Bap/LapF family prefix-like domain-containing protein n=1 Tax=Stenoxybacter acetivorans TaxID=422441 RepID=UPI001FE0480C